MGDRNDHSADGDASIMENHDGQPTGGNSRQSKNPSLLTKDFNISRHERRKSQMDSEPCITDSSVVGASEMSGGATSHYSSAALDAFSQNEQIGLKGNLAANDKNNRRRIKSVLGSEYGAKQPLDMGESVEPEKFPRYVNEVERNSAYDTI